MRLAHAALTALLLCAPALAQEAEAPPASEGALPRTPNARELRGLIKALGADDWAAREAARERLLDLGPEAVPWLERAARDPDPQRALVAQELLRSLRWRVPEDVRKTVGDALDDFPALPHPRRLEVLARCGQLGVQARAAAGFLINAARFDPDAQVRHAAVDAYLQVTVGDVPDQDRAALEALADEKDPGASTFLLRARLLERLGRPDDAAAAAGQAYLKAPGHLPLALYLLDLLLARGDLDTALEVAGDAEARHPQSPEVRVRAGEAIARAGGVEEGLERLKSVMDAEGVLERPDLLLRLGQAYLRCERVAEAEQVFRASLGRYPYNRELNVALADVFLAAGRRREAVEIYLSEVRYATPGTAGFQGLRERLATILREGGAARLADEDAFYDDARRGRPVVQVRRAVAAWLQARGLREEAAEELRAACALAPGDAALRVALGDCLRDQRDLAGARAAYEEAAALDARWAARLRDLAGLAASPPPAEAPTGFSSWEWRLGGETLGKTTEAVTDDAPPPPLVLRDRIVVPLAGATDLFGLDAADGALLWRFTPEPPPFEGGEALPEQTGLELLALVEAPAAAVAALDPRRARTGAPVVVALYNAFWRPLHRTWRAARFTGLHAFVLDPATGALLGRRDLDAKAQVVSPAPVARRGRVLCFASPRAKRVVLELVDLVAGRPLWQAGLPYVAMRRPLFADDRLLVAWDAAVVALGEDGERRWSYEHGGPERGPERGDEDGPPATHLTTDLARCGDGVLVGTSDGRLLRLALDGGAATELARVGPDRLTGEVVVAGRRAFVAARGGAVHALDLAPDLAQVTSRAWTLPGPRAAARSLTWAGELLFALNGSDDAFADEVPLLLAIDPDTGAVLLQRPVDRPATLAAGHGLVVVAAGGRQSRLGLKATGIRPHERLDPAQAKLAALSGAARDALHEGQFEVSAVVARKVVQAAGGLDALSPEALATVARTLARSKREEEALDLIHQGEERAGKDEAVQALWAEVRRELGLEER
ncbi:MAG: PQQ-binding-like beta-propeller repeat protein [Planctomycetes bacterium]|nr:PQQ-binding-like beta-propeller repeat protein [Planctomycetota bacterium]